MFKSKLDNVEVYFICYKEKGMDLVETYYDPVLNTHNWYFNCYIAYNYWKEKFLNLKIGEITRMLLTIAASKYIIYKLENEEFKNKKEKQKLEKELKKIEPEIRKIMTCKAFEFKS